MNILVLSDNAEILERAKPIFLKRTDVKYCFTNSDDINPKLDYKHIIKTYDLVFSLHCKKIFPKELVEGVRCINIHPGLRRGMFTHVHDLADERNSGCAIHEMVKDIDLGPIIDYSNTVILEEDTSVSLYNRIIDDEMLLLEKHLNAIIEEDYNCPIQFGTNYFSFSDFKNLCEIDLDKEGTFREFYNLLRALSHPPYWNAHIKGTDIYLRLCIQKQSKNQSEQK